MGLKQVGGVVTLLLVAVVLIVLFAHAAKGFRQNEGYDNHGLRQQDVEVAMETLEACVRVALLLAALLLVGRGAQLAIQARPTIDAVACVGLGLAVLLSLAIAVQRDEAWGAAIGLAALVAGGCVYALKRRENA